MNKNNVEEPTECVPMNNMVGGKPYHMCHHACITIEEVVDSDDEVEELEPTPLVTQGFQPINK
jgi:hypothetical protein